MGIQYSSLFRAAKEVAGDFFDVFLLSDGTLVFLVGDVCGKGVGSALFMSLFRSLIRVTVMNENGKGEEDNSRIASREKLAHVLSFTNHYVTETHAENNLFATLFIGFLDPTSGRMTYANCGNEPAIMAISNESFREYPPTGPVIGAFAEAQFAIEETTLSHGQILFAFTDGITDAIDANQNPFGREAIMRILKAGEFSPHTLIQTICAAVDQFTRGMNQFDDMTLLAIKRK